MNRDDLINPFEIETTGTALKYKISLKNLIDAFKVKYPSIRRYVTREDIAGHQLKWNTIDIERIETEESITFDCAYTIEQMRNISTENIMKLTNFGDGYGNYPFLSDKTTESNTISYKLNIPLRGYMDTKSDWEDGEREYVSGTYNWTTESFTIPSEDDEIADWYAISYLMENRVLSCTFGGTYDSEGTFHQNYEYANVYWQVSTTDYNYAWPSFSSPSLPKYFLADLHTKNMLIPSSYTRWYDDFSNTSKTNVSFPSSPLAGIPGVSSMYGEFTDGQCANMDDYPACISASISLLEGQEIFMFKNRHGWCTLDGKCQIFMRKKNNADANKVWELRYVVNDKEYWHYSKETTSTNPISAHWNTWPNVDIEIGKARQSDEPLEDTYESGSNVLYGKAKMNTPIIAKYIDNNAIAYYDYEPTSGCYVSRGDGGSVVGYNNESNSWVLNKQN